MYRLIVVLSLLLPAITALSCSDSGTEPDDPAPPRELTKTELELLQAGNSFGLTLFSRMAAEDPTANLFISPLSVSMALGMTLNGAAGDTWEEMRQTLAYGNLSQHDINRSYKSLIELLRGMDPQIDLLIANSIWSRQEFIPEQSFVDTNRYYFDAEIQSLDFSSPQASATINAWVKAKTKEKIDGIVPDNISPEVVMYLINALYFKGEWTTQFDPDNTRDATFTAVDGSKQTVNMMEGEIPMRVAEQDGVVIADIPYGRELYSMTVVLPPVGSELQSLIAGLDDRQWSRWLDELVEQETVIQMPRFKLTSDLTLNDALKVMGMEIAFDPLMADFTRINAAGGLYISDVKHKTCLEVNEQGSEAAAATSVEISYRSVPSVLRLDRPFLCAIRENHGGTILFIGSVMSIE